MGVWYLYTFSFVYLLVFIYRIFYSAHWGASTISYGCVFVLYNVYVVCVCMCVWILVSTNILTDVCMGLESIQFSYDVYMAMCTLVS